MAQRITYELDESIFNETFLGLIRDRDAVKKALSEAAFFSIPPGESFVKQGRIAADLVFLLNGAAKLELANGGPVQTVGAVLPMQAVDIQVMLDGASHPHSAVATEESSVLVLNWKKFLPVLQSTPGLAAYLRRLSQYAPLRQLRDNLADVGCSSEFQVELIGALEEQKAPAQSWLVRQGEIPGAAVFLISGSVQAFRKGAGEALTPLWVVPAPGWQLWQDAAEGAPARNSLKALDEAALFRLDAAALKKLQQRFPADFEHMSRLARHAPSTEEKEADGADQEVENLEEMFPPHPRRLPFFRLRFPHVRQKDEMDCGAACMAMITRYYGNDIPIHFWRERMGVNQEGSSLFDMAKTAERVGFVAHGLQVPDIRSIGRSLFPFVALRGYHFLVVYDLKGDQLTIGDPGLPAVRRVPLEKFLKGYEGYALLLRPTERFYQETVAKRGSLPYKEILKSHSQEMGMILLCSLVLMLLSLPQPLMSQFVIDEVLAKKDPSLLMVAVSGIMLFGVMNALTSWLRTYYMNYVASKFDFSLASGFMRKLMSLPYDFFATRHVGDFTRRLAELETVRSLATGQVIGVLLDFLNLGVYGVVLFFYSPSIALATFIIAPVSVLLSVLFSHKMRQEYQEYFTARKEQDGLVSGLIKGVPTIKSLGAELAARWRFEEAMVNSLKARHDTTMTAALLGGVSGLMNQIISYGLLSFAAYLAIRGELTPGQVIASSMLVGRVLGPFHALAGAWNQVQQARIIIERLNDVLLAEPETKTGDPALVKQRLRGEIEFRDVWFRYGGESSDWVLQGISFKIMPGQRVAVVGPSGAGKSTIAYLTTRLYEPQKGQILIDGQDYRDYDRQWLRSQIGLFLQEGHLFPGTITENIAFGDAAPDSAHVRAAAKLAYADEFITQKSSGYDYRISASGLGLSGGEKQRIAIARSLYNDPPVLVMDESTSNLDTKAEKAVMANLKADGKERTLIAIAHRYSTVRACDYAIVVEAGKVTEFGTHDELLTKKGRYAELFSGQIDI